MSIFNGKNNTCFCAYRSYSIHEIDGNHTIIFVKLLAESAQISFSPSPHRPPIQSSPSVFSIFIKASSSPIKAPSHSYMQAAFGPTPSQKQRRGAEDHADGRSSGTHGATRWVPRRARLPLLSARPPGLRRHHRRGLRGGWGGGEVIRG
jgi:hypothetical protein